MNKVLPFCVFFVVAFAGCSRSPTNEFQVAGVITLAGEPIHSGRVYFTPMLEKGNDGPQGVALIHNGRFDTRQPGGRPAPPGAVRVRVDGYGPPLPGKANGPSLVWEYEVEKELPRNDSTLDLNLPESARARPAPKEVVSP